MLGELKKSKSKDLDFFIQAAGLAWNHPQGAWNPSQSDGMAYSLLAHRLHGGTSCYVPSLTERSRSNLHSLADKQACRLASLDYHASACISPSDGFHASLRDDSIQGFALIPYLRQAADFIHALRRDYIESYVEALDFGGLFVFLGVKNNPLSPLHLFPDLWT